MKALKLTAIVATVLITLISCGSKGKEATAEGFSEIEKEIKNKFGDEAYFTDLNVIYNKSIGNTVTVIVTTDPESLKMEEWIQPQGSWKQTSEISLEIPKESKAADFMFQLGNEISLTQLGGLIEKSKKQLHEEKDLENPTLSIASVVFPDNGDISKAEYSIHLKPENGGITFRFSYKLNGELLKMDF